VEKKKEADHWNREGTEGGHHVKKSGVQKRTGGNLMQKEKQRRRNFQLGGPQRSPPFAFQKIRTRKKKTTGRRRR